MTSQSTQTAERRAAYVRTARTVAARTPGHESGLPRAPELTGRGAAGCCTIGGGIPATVDLRALLG